MVDTEDWGNFFWGKQERALPICPALFILDLSGGPGLGIPSNSKPNKVTILYRPMP
jgi:hypothetical protein